MSIEPPSLAARLEQTGPLSWREAARLTARLARVLDRLHAQSPAHGGIEPLTVLFVGGTVRLADPLPQANRDAAFVEPRVAAGAPADRQSDFFALGRIMAAMVAADPHHPGDGSPDRLPPPLAAVQARLVAAEPPATYRSGNDIAAALELAIAASEGFAEASAQPVPAPLHPAPLPPAPLDPIPRAPGPEAAPLPKATTRAAARQPGRRRSRLALVLSALLIVGGLAVLWLRSGDEVAVDRPAEATDPPRLPQSALVAAPAPAADPATDSATDSEVPAPDVADEPSLEQVLAMLPELAATQWGQWLVRAPGRRPRSDSSA